MLKKCIAPSTSSTAPTTDRSLTPGLQESRHRVGHDLLAAIQRDMTIERNQVAIDAVSASLTGQQN